MHRLSIIHNNPQLHIHVFSCSKWRNLWPRLPCDKQRQVWSKRRIRKPVKHASIQYTVPACVPLSFSLSLSPSPSLSFTHPSSACLQTGKFHGTFDLLRARTLTVSHCFTLRERASTWLPFTCTPWIGYCCSDWDSSNLSVLGERRRTSVQK